MRTTFLSPALLLTIAVFNWHCAKPSTEQKAGNGVVYLNTAKTVKYVGSEKCAPCHNSIYESYIKSEMGRSMSKLDSTTEIIESYPQKYEVYDSLKNFYYQMVQRGKRFYQREYRRDDKGRIIHERWMEAEYIMGSGNNLRMYFHDENGMLYQLPLTWYVHKRQWDLSPGYRDFGNLRFSRFATARCISCHNAYPETSPAADERYVKPFPLGIGCERCHGPGELHLRQKIHGELANLPDSVRTIVNPRKLPPEPQLDVCRQCHLQGKAWALHGDSDWFDFRPGTALSTHRSVYFPAVTPKEVFEVADSPHRLSLSRCYQESNGAITCISCHNPHFSIKTFSAEHYNQACLQCHTPTSLPDASSRQPHAPADNCIACHMNRTGTDNTLHGVSNTDHWIRIDANQTAIDWRELKQPPEKKGAIALVPDVDANEKGSLARKGIAYLDYYRHYDQRRAYLDSALSYLSRGLNFAKDDSRGFFHRGEVQLELGKHDEAISSFAQAAALQPGYAEAHYKLGTIYLAKQDFDAAISSYQQAFAQKPGDPRFIEGMGIALAEKGEFDAAKQFFERALQIDRQNPHTYYYLGNIYVQKLRQPERAVPYYKELVVLDPDFPNGYMNLANTYGLIGNYKEALALYEKELFLRPQSPLAYFNLGRVYMLMGKRDEARQAFREVLNLDPTMILAAQYLAQLQ